MDFDDRVRNRQAKTAFREDMAAKCQQLRFSVQVSSDRDIQFPQTPFDLSVPPAGHFRNIYVAHRGDVTPDLVRGGLPR